MTRSLALSFSLCLAIAGPAAAQAGVEAGLGAARAATTTAPVKGVGNAISGLSGALERALKPGQQDTPERPRPAAAAKPAARPTPAWEDPAVVETGLAYDELTRRFGPPIMAITNTTARSLTYRGKEGYYQIELRDGVVATIAKPEP